MMMKSPVGKFLFAVCLWSLVFGLWSDASWAAKSLWELRGQTKESSQGETVEPQKKAEVKPIVVKKASREVNPELASFIEKMEVPSQYGRVKERFTGTGDQFFVLMQEIHNHPEVQKNNKEIETVLLDQYQIPLILIEGYYGPLTAPTLRSQPREWRERFANEKLESGYYRAEEHLYLTREVPPVVIGVDDERIVKEQYDLVHYQYLVENRPRAEAVFDRLNHSIELAKVKLYSTPLKALDVSSQEYAEDKISSEEFVSILNQELKGMGLPISHLIYPNIDLMVRGLDAEEADNYEKAQEFFKEIDHSQLFAEIKKLEDKIRSKLFKGPQDKELARLAKAVYYFGKLSNISLVPLEWEEYIQELSPYTIPGISQFLQGAAGISVNLTPEETAFLEKYRSEGETFYQIAIDRERTMVENSLARLDDQKTNKAVVVTGGFHTAGISQFLKANDISYIVIAPRVTRPDMATPYQELLKKTIGNFNKTLQEAPSAAAMANRKALMPVVVENEVKETKEDTSK